MCNSFAGEFWASCYRQTFEYGAIWRQSKELETENEEKEEEQDETGEERKGENKSNGEVGAK